MLDLLVMLFVLTGAGDEIDENLKFWRIREVGASQGTKEIIGGDELGGGRDFKYPLTCSLRGLSTIVFMRYDIINYF